MARPRDPEIDDRILAAARGLVDERGPEALTVSGVAERAGVSRPSVYRRWPSRAALLYQMAIRDSVTDIPDTGSLYRDLVEIMVQYTVNTNAGDRAIAAEQNGAQITDAAFAAVVGRDQVELELGRVYVVWERAVERQEVLPTADGMAVLDDLAALGYWNVLLHHRDAGWVEPAVRRLLSSVDGYRGEE